LDAGRRAVLLTAAEFPELHPDDAPLLTAFVAAGWRVTPTVWSDAIPDADLAMVRSCWDYTERAAEFLEVIDAVGGRMQLWNPPATVRWNADKRYLLALAERGVTTPPTVVVPRGDRRTLAAVLDDLNADEAVVKPLVGASGVDTWRTRAGAEADWRRAVLARDLLVQPFVPEVLVGGEWSLVFFHDGFSHAVVKRAAEGEFRVQAEHGGAVAVAVPSERLVAAAERTLAAVPHPWRYARVDGIDTASGFLVMEVELIEPELFFTIAPGAAERLVASLADGAAA
jgi:glutathione synthase/RimK-type ligase-like ATP-grasp enzyme